MHNLNFIQLPLGTYLHHLCLDLRAGVIITDLSHFIAAIHVWQLRSRTHSFCWRLTFATVYIQTNKSFQEQLSQSSALSGLQCNCQASGTRSVFAATSCLCSRKQTHVELQPTDTVVINWEAERSAAVRRQEDSESGLWRVCVCHQGQWLRWRK